ncbi:DUF6029 family protein [Porphyromonas sp.]|uniref:DUF6029 family protein n=1 Tax=Porphyromonas sp. TaxID=1924944 RepID=UPI0026DC485C|nr:DUF6029 family protein [Porphyromonas sp.]MDO4770345.1 DUF6029 family protein [Porphyromonas sp.]
MNKLITSLIASSALWSTLTVSAQEQKKDRGNVHGGIESNATLYKKDESNPDIKNYGNNTYLNLKYDYKNFGAGLQYEIFEPPLRGYPEDLKGNGLVQYYLGYSNEKLSVTAGSFYEQFGSGLIFRAFEERSLGINNSLRGFNVKYTPTDWLQLKVMGGQPRKYITYADAIIGGGDADVTISRLWEKEGKYDVTIGGAWVTKKNTKNIPESVDPDMMHLYSARAGFSAGGFNLGAEYTVKGMGQSFSPYAHKFLKESGTALLFNLDYIRTDFGISGTFRRIEHMDFRIDNKLQEIYVPMNYIPALTKQHKYALPSLYPHQTNSSGEIGGQVDMYYNLTADWIGKYPLKVALNMSYYNSLGRNPMETMPFFGREGEKNFSEVSIELGKRFSRAIQVNAGLHFQDIIHNAQMHKSFAQVLDVLWKVNKKASLRTELQHMKTEMDEKGWIYGLVEFGFAPHFTLYGSDMYSYAAENKEHYYSVGASFTYKSFRLMTSYGRSRAGVQCVGGICRYVPEYTGLTANLSYVF